MTARTWWHLAAMVALGAVCFAGFGWAVAWRQQLPVSPPSGTDTVVAGREPAEVLARGLRGTATGAARQLADGRRGDAVTAIDAAWRLAEVGRHATGGTRRWAFAAAYLGIEQARTSIQRGDPSGARRALEQVRATMARAIVADGRARPPAPGDRDRYRGAVVRNAAGQPIGEVDHLSGDPDGDAVLRLGGAPDVFGVVDLGHPTTVTVPARSLLCGDPGAAGPTEVVVATFATAADDVAASTAG